MATELDAVEQFEHERARLLRLAYRMLGSMADAEDVVQEAYLRWRRAEVDAVGKPASFLSRVVTWLCLDVMKTSRAKRETYIGEWLPEPIVEADDDAMRADELTLTLMLALERLSPLERAAFLLMEVFDTPAGEVAAMLERDPAAVRQLASRAKKHVKLDHSRYPVERAEGDRIAQAFLAATQSGDTTTLRGLLADNVTIRSDGGGKVLSYPNMIDGVDKTLRLYEGLLRKYGPFERLLRPLWIDGLPGYLSLQNGTLQTTAFDIADGKIVAIYIVRNPDKLGQFMPEGGLQ